MAYGNPEPGGAGGAYGGTGGSGSFQDWLSALPTAESLAPAFRKGYGETHRQEAQVVPAMWLAYAKQGEPLINQSAQAQRRSTISGAGNARRELERNLLNAYQGQGVSQLYARKGLAETMPQLGYQTEQQLGGIESQRLENVFGFRSGIQNALAQGYTGERLFAEQLNQAYKGRRDARHAGQFGERMALAQFLTSISAMFANPGGGGMSGGGYGGGGGGGGASNQTAFANQGTAGGSMGYGP
jgi:hypothetical protein